MSYFFQYLDYVVQKYRQTCGLLTNERPSHSFAMSLDPMEPFIDIIIEWTYPLWETYRFRLDKWDVVNPCKVDGIKELDSSEWNRIYYNFCMSDATHDLFHELITLIEDHTCNMAPLEVREFISEIYARRPVFS